MRPEAFPLLLVDDDEAFRERLAVSFRRKGYPVETAADASEAFALIAQKPFAGAVVDLKLPGENGLAVVRSLREACPGARIIVLTGYGSIATAIDAIRLGAADYLSKPADGEQIEAALLALERPEGEAAPVAVPSLERVEWEYLQRVLHECGGNISKTARMLGMERRSLQRRLQKYPPPQ